jgi:hypothetical protein
MKNKYRVCIQGSEQLWIDKCGSAGINCCCGGDAEENCG